MVGKSNEDDDAYKEHVIAVLAVVLEQCIQAQCVMAHQQ